MKFSSVVYSIIAVLAVYVIGNYLDLFTTYIWFDMPMHFAGGFVMGMLAIWLMNKARFSQNPAWSQLLFAIGFAVVIGVLWEYYEYAIDSFVVHEFGWEPMTLRDTLSDFFFDGLGGAIAWIIFKKRII
jgi:hypothetical protein